MIMVEDMGMAMGTIRVEARVMAEERGEIFTLDHTLLKQHVCNGHANSTAADRNE
jgi:hypothetical protein